MGSARSRITALYGAHPLHLVAFGASFALAGYVAFGLFAHQTFRVIVWLAGAAVVHDVLILPGYALANLALTWFWRRRPMVGSVAWLNYVRFPAAIAAMLFVIYSPEITRQRTAQLRDSGVSNHAYLSHWLLVTGIVFSLSAMSFLVRILVGVRSGPSRELSRVAR